MGVGMSDASLTHEQAQKLLKELSSNDVFRQRFEEKPAAALVELGIPHETVINLNAACLAPIKLAGKSVFGDALSALSTADSNSCLTMISPQLRLDAGKPLNR